MAAKIQGLGLVDTALEVLASFPLPSLQSVAHKKVCDERLRSSGVPRLQGQVRSPVKERLMYAVSTANRQGN